MRLFKSSNKSQASIDRSTNSRPSSPDPAHSRSSYVGVGGGAHQFADRPGFPQPPLQPTDDHNLSYLQDSQGQSHPAHVLSRPSTEGPGYVEGDPRRPSVPINLIPPTSPQPIHVQVPDPRGPAPVPGQTQFGHAQQVHVPADKEHKRSKRSIFGLSKDKDKDKDKENLHSPTDKKSGLGRSGSIHLLRKSHHQPQQSGDISVHSPSSPQYSNRQSYFGRSDHSLDNSPEDPSHYEQYRQQQYQAQQQQQQLQQQQQQQQQHYESPSSQYSQRSPEYQNQAQAHAQAQQQQQQQHHYPPPPQEQYQAYQQTGSANSSEHYLPYQQQRAPPGRPSNIVLDEQYQSLRPPSQTSLGPPSPIQGPAHQDSRPSTSQTSRYSVQSVGQIPQAQAQQQMARGDIANGNARQQSHQRDPRDEHAQYQHDPRARMSQHQPDQGRNTPPPQRSNREDPRDMDYSILLSKHEELQAKYSKVKRYYFEREAQVTQLQNTVATQRLSMSKTSLDDAQYAQRFERLSGAINNLAFNIRKDWKKVPPWLQSVCNVDAHAIGTKEMTAVGRTCITRWLNDTLFKQTFHPGIPTEVSTYLKAIESNLRSQASSGLMFTDEQRDDHLNKLTTWRLTTIEGLAPYLNSKEAASYQESITTSLTNALTGSLQANLKEPPPPGLSEGVATIISQAVSLAANIPLESRDIVISYFMPGEMINENLMKVETGMTALTNPGQEARQASGDSAGPDADEEDGGRGDSVEEQIREAAAKATQSAQQGRGDSVASMTPSASSAGTIKSADKTNGKGKGGSSFLGGFVSKKPTPQQSVGGGAAGQRSAGSGVSRDQAQQAADSAGEQQRGAEGSGSASGGGATQNPNLQPGEGRIRFAAFLAVEVRGKMGGAKESAASGAGGAPAGGQSSSGSVLFKAPVFEL